MFTTMFNRLQTPSFRAVITATNVSIVACALMLTSAADATPKILTPHEQKSQYLPDFSYAGYEYGLVDIATPMDTIVNVLDFGVIADDGNDDSQAMLAALEEAHSINKPVVVLLPAGELIISEILKIKRSNIVLRGQGSGQGGTTLFFPRPLKLVDKGESLKELTKYLAKYDKRQKEPARNINEMFSEYSWSGGFIWVQKDQTRAAPYLEDYDPLIEVVARVESGTVGDKNVIVSSSDKLNVGDVLELQWLNRKGENGPLLTELYGDTDLAIGSHHWTKPARPLIRQKTKIISIQGSQITLGDPLLHTISADIPAQFARWQHLTRVGIEDLHLSFPSAPYFGHHLEQGYNGVYFTSVYNGWIRDLKITNADSGILTYNSANVTITDITSAGERRGHYAVHVGNVHNVLVKNLMIHNPLQHSLSFNTQSTRSVFTNAHVFKEPVLDQHAGANHQNLFDDVHVYITAKKNQRGKPYYAIWDGSGAGYWQPGHGRYNTTWNLKVNVLGGAARNENVTLTGIAEGPDARIVGVSGNRRFEIDYRPKPHMESINEELKSVPSLYHWQLQRRKVTDAKN